MMKIGPAVAAAAVFAIASPVCAQDAVQWRVEDGGNGHWYQFRRSTSLLCWHDARHLCEQLGGHLATITTAAENSLLLDLTIPEYPGGIPGGPYIGGTCEGLPWGQWSWITGEQFGFTAWMAGAPNGWGGATEPYLHFWRWQDLGWNDNIDCGDDMFCYLVEWESDCNHDGIVDYGQIRNGTFPDVNANGVPDCCEPGESCTPCPGDVTNGGTVDAADLSILLAAWGTNGQGEFDTDLNGDGLVDGGDLALVLGGWGACP